MKWERTDLVVGLVVVTTVAILAGALLWIMPALTQRTYPLYTEFGNVDGIGERAPVQLHGYRIGYVDDIEPRMNPSGTLVFRVRMAIHQRLESGQEFRLPEGTEALLTPPPLPIGAGFIVLSYPPEGGEPLEPGSVIAGRRALVAMDHVQSLSTRLDDQVLQTTSTARALMDSLTITAAAVNRSLALTNAAIPPLVHGLQLQLAATEALTDDMRTQLNSLGPSAVAGIDSATALLADSRKMVQQMTGVLATSEAEIAGILANLDTTTVLVQSLVRQFSDRPLRVFLSGARPPDGYSRPR